MPCYQVRLTTVEFKADYVDLLTRAVEVLGWSVKLNETKTRAAVVATGRLIDLDLAAGRATFLPDQQGQVNLLKREYSKQTIKAYAKLNQWQPASTKANGMEWELTKEEN